MEPTGPTDNELPAPIKPKRPYHRKVTLTPRAQERRMPEPPKKSAMITYIPLDHGDPVENVFGGIRFKANVPVEVPRTHTILQLIVEKIETKDGELRTHGVERQIPLIEVLRGNSSFEIDGVRPERIKPHARVPEDADQYRGYCINWIFASTSADSMDKRWIGEEGLRRRCGVSPSDIDQLRPFFESRRMECAELDKQRHVA